MTNKQDKIKETKVFLKIMGRAYAYEQKEHTYGCQCHGCIAMRKKYLENGLWPKNYSARELGVEDEQATK